MTLATTVDELVVLDRMEEIVSRDMLTRGSYVVRVDNRPLSCRVAVHGALEALFELGDRRALGPDAEFMGQIIRRAKELVESEAR